MLSHLRRGEGALQVAREDCRGVRREPGLRAGRELADLGPEGQRVKGVEQARERVGQVLVAQQQQLVLVDGPAAQSVGRLDTWVLK